MKLGLRQKLLVSVFVSAAALAAAQHAMAATIYVNPGDSIQAAVNAATSGDTIVIAAGTYTENVTINKALTFQGANFGVSGNATRGAESTINGAFTVASNSITIDGLRFNGGASAVRGESGANAYDNLVIQNNLIQNTTDSAIRLGLGSGGGLGSDNWTISHNRIENITGNALTGMVLFNVTGLTVTDNVVNHDNAGSTGRRGINLDGVQNATVTGNTVNMGLVNPTDPSAASSAAPWVIQVSMSDREVSDVNISNNSVSGAYRGITPLSQRTITNLDISGNTVSNVIQGIVLNTGSTAPQTTGVTFDIDVIGNTITTTTAGTGTFTCGTGCAIYVRDLHDAHPNGPIVFSNLDITGNTITGGPIQVGGTETFVSGSGTGNGLVNLTGFINIQGGAGSLTEGTFTAPANPGFISQTSGSNIVVGSGATVTGQDASGNTLTASGGSTVELGSNTTISGNTLVGTGGAVDGGTTGSPYVITGNTQVQAGGTLGGNGNLSGSLLNAGNVGPGNSPGIINVGSYVGSGGILTMEADLATAAPVAGTTFDQLNVAGNVTGTSTSITLTQVNPGTAVPTTGLGMALVTVGGTVASDAFTMSQFIANGYTFSLRYRQDFSGTTDGFFLVSGHCQTSGLADVCLVDSTTDLLVPIDAQGGTDTLQLGGATNFSFDLAAVGPVFQNFESLEKTGTSNITLTGTNTLTGSVAVTGGTLTASGGSAINDASAVSVASGATLALSASETIGSLAGAGGVSMGANSLTTGGNNTSTAFSGAISGSGSVTKVGTGTMTLSGTNTFTGGLLINAGEVSLLGGSALADALAVTAASGTTLSLGASETLGSLAGAGSVGLGANTLTAGGNNGSTTFSGAMSGTGGLTKAGTGTMTLSGANTFTGGISLLQGTLRLANNSAAGTGTITTLGSVIDYADGVSIANPVVISSNTTQFQVLAGSATQSGNIGESGGARPFEKIGAGTLVLSGTNTFTGPTSITAGTLATAGGAAIADTSAVTVASGATLSLGANETVASIAGAGSVGLGAFSLTSGGSNASTTLSGAVTGTGGLTKVGTGTLTLSGTNTYSGATTISAGTLATTGSTAIGDASAVTVASGATLSLGGSETIGGLSGAGSVVLGANTLTSGSGAFTGTTAGTGGLTKAGAGTLSTGALAHTGLTTVSGGTLNVNGSTAGSVLVSSGGTLSGNTAIGGNLTLNAGGTLSSGNSPGTTTVAGNFAGGGILNVEVQFSNAGAPVNGTTHDFLNITGNVTGVSTLNILAVAPSTPAALTTGNGIELVRVGGTTSASAFALSGPVVQGGVQYVLSYLADYSGTLDGYFLQSSARDEIAGHAAMLASSRTLLARCHRGEERNSAQGAVAGGKRAWAKYGTGSIESGADTGLQMDQDYTCTAGGIDLASGADLRLGVVGGFGSTEVDITTLAGVSRLDGDLGLIEAQAAYAKDGMFVNLSAGYASTDWTHTGTVSGVKAATVDGLVGSLMVGRQWALGTDWQLGVSGEINYDGTTCSDACILAGVTAEESNWRAGLGAKLAGTMPAFRPFVSVSWSDDLSGGNTVSLGTVSVAADTAASLFGARAGFEANLSEKIGLFADVGMVEGLDTSVSGIDGQAGLRIFW